VKRSSHRNHHPAEGRAKKAANRARNRINPRRSPIEQLLDVMAILRSPTGCPWDREQTHRTLRYHAVEEVYELMDAIDAGDDHEMVEELGDLLLQVVFHAQLARERGAFDFDQICRSIVEKLVRRHPHVFGDSDARTVDAVWAQWEQIKKAEKSGTRHHRASALDGIPKHLPALLRAEKLVKKARKAKLLEDRPRGGGRRTQKNIGRVLFELAEAAQRAGWSAEALLRDETARRERQWRGSERMTNDQ
jgi:NTP pyrophosphatase (non-canonical NTP hydrolase)